MSDASIDTPQLKVTKDLVKKGFDFWNDSKKKPLAKEIVQYVFGDKTMDARNLIAKELLAKLKKLGVDPARSYQRHKIDKKTDFELSEEQKQFISNNAVTMTWWQCAKELFGESISALKTESVAVRKYYESLPSNVKLVNDESIVKSDYRPPKTIEQALKRIDIAVRDHSYNRDKISASQRREIERLMSFLHTPRFIRQVSTYEKQMDRELFECAFIGCVYNKPDLTQEEIDQYIIYASECIIGFSNQKRVEMLQNLLDEAATGHNQDVKMTMTLVQSITSAQKEYNDCVLRQRKILDALTQKRSERISKRIEQTGSILNLVQAWREEESRKKMIKFANIRRESIKKEINKLESMDSLDAQLMGITHEEILDG